MELYRSYSSYLKETYGERVYKLPINIPVSCPNRDGTKGYGGCIFCGASGSGHELRSETETVTEQLAANAAYMGRRYKAKKFVAYFQSFTNTWCSDENFYRWMEEACAFPGVVAIAISTRPDALNEQKLSYLKQIKQRGIDITVELGLQSVNDETLRILNRGHTLSDYETCATRIREAGLDLCTHLISDLPWDSDGDVYRAAEIINRYGGHVKIHSLYVEKGTKLAELYESGEVSLLTKEDFLRRTEGLLVRLKPSIIIDRLLGRVPEKDSVVANFNESWWKVRDELLEKMAVRGLRQGSLCQLDEI